jgi:trehalose 6-phosphate phosphatase
LSAQVAADEPEEHAMVTPRSCGRSAIMSGGSGSQSAAAEPDIHSAIAVGRPAFLFDLDGTLIDLAPAPDSVTRPKGLIETLMRLSAMTQGAVAVVTGRTLASVDGILAPLRLVGAGVHGLELRAAPRAPVRAAGPRLPPGIRRVALRFGQENPGVVVEDKGRAVALHYRARPEAHEAVGAFADAVVRRHPGAVSAQPGKMVVELRPPGADKGDAVRALMELPAFSGRTPIYFGDDLTDEAAFAAAQTLGGRGVLVGAHGGPTAAGWRVATPGGLRAALRALAAMEPARWR